MRDYDAWYQCLKCGSQCIKGFICTCGVENIIENKYQRVLQVIKRIIDSADDYRTKCRKINKLLENK